MVSPSSPGSDAELPRRWRRLRTLASVAMGLVLLVWSVFLVAWLALHWVILPHIDEWRPAIERHASQAIGLKLSIGAIQVQSSGWVPAIELRDLRLFDREGREALLLARVQAALAPQSLLSLQLRFEQLLIDGARLELRRDASGRLRIAGLDWRGSVGAEDTRAREWFFAQHEFIIRNGTLRWVDETGDAPPLELTQLDLVLRNGLRRHALRLDATPPAAWGQRFSLRGQFTQPLLAPPGQWQRWSGTLYAELPYADISELRRHLRLPFEWGEGAGALRAWVDVARGMPGKATVDFALRAVSMRLNPDLERLAFEQVQGRFDAERDAGGVKLRLRKLGLRTGDGLDWPAGELSLAWRQKQDLGRLLPSTQPVTGGELSADRLELEVLARTAARLPLGEAMRTLLGQLAPRGTVQSLKASWHGPLDAPLEYQVSAGLEGLNLQGGAPPNAAQPASAGRPGVRNARLQFNASERGGDARLSIRSGALVFPGVWQQPELPFDRLDASLAWRILPQAGRPPRIELKLGAVNFANADMQGELGAEWSTGVDDGTARGGRYPGRLDLSGKLQRARADSVARYLPLGLAPAVREYVQHSIQGGHIDSASFRIKGDLREFPFQHSREGELRISLQVQDLRYDFLPGHPGADGTPRRDSPWPGLDKVSGELRLDRLALSFRGATGRLWGYELRDVHGGVQDLSDPRRVLTLEGRGRGPAADLLRFVGTTPVGTWIGPALGPVSASGNSELELSMRLPLLQPTQATVAGNVRLAGGDLRLAPDLPLLQAARGAIDFTQQGFSLRDASARVFGGDANIDGGLGADGTLRFGVQGVATAEALRATPQIAGLAQLAGLLRGQAAYRATLALNQGQSELTISSNLVGMQIDLPPPLAKTAPVAWPMRLQLTPLVDAGAPSAGRRDNLSFELGDMLKAQYQRKQSGTVVTVLRGSLALFDTLPMPVAGVQASLNLGRVDLDAWQQVLERFDADDGPAGGGVAAASGYLPQMIDLRADELRSGARMLSNVAATLQHQVAAQDSAWRASVRADQLEGQIEYRPPRPPAQAGRVMARLQRLSVPQAEVATVENLLAQPPASVPALDIVVDDFELRGRKLGRIEVEAVNRLLPGRAGQREWQLDKLNLSVPEAQLEASGRWSATGARRMALDFKLELADSGAFIERLGAGRALRGGKGLVQGQLSWAGSPLTLDYPSMQGKLRLDVDAGQFLNADPGGARLLSVLSLQALPRRLSLDFRDLFQEGFAFDSIAGDVSVARGSADTRNLTMRGAQATVLMEGSADLLRETQDLRVLIVPNFDASGAALATMAINPAIGLGTLFAQWLLREPLRAAGTREFHITGTWAEPQVQAVERAADAPAPQTDPPSAAPSSGTIAPTETRPPG